MTEQQQRELATGLRALADSTRHASSSSEVEAAVLSHMAHANRGRGPRQAPVGPQHPVVRARSGGFLPLAAALVLAVGGTLWTARSVPVYDIVHPAGFVALPDAAVLPDMESASIVRVSLPVTALPVYGVAIEPDVTSGSVLAELLVAQDGQARAIRLVNESDRSRSRNND